LYKDNYKTINKLIETGYLSEDKKSIYNYGFFILLGYLVALVVILISGFINRLVFESLIFLICAMSFRVNIGGFHFASSKFCFAVSYISIALMPFFIKYLSINNFLAILIILSISIYIWLVAPIDSPSKRLSPKAKLNLKKRINKLLIFWSSLVVLLYYLDMINFLMSLFFSYLLCLVLLLTAQVLYKR
jgi:accessory gene regulator B